MLNTEKLIAEAIDTKKIPHFAFAWEHNAAPLDFRRRA